MIIVRIEHTLSEKQSGCGYYQTLTQLAHRECKRTEIATALAGFVEV